MSPARAGDSRPSASGGSGGEVSAGRYDSFVVRVFSGGRAAALIQGQVTHVGSHDTMRFTNPNRVIGFIMAHVGRSTRGTESPGRPQQPLAGEDGSVSS